MRKSMLGLFIFLMGVQISCTTQRNTQLSGEDNLKVQQEILQLSKDKWQWMSDKDVAKIRTAL